MLAQVYMGKEGPNVRRFLKFEVLDGRAKKAENFSGRLPCKGRGGTPRYAGSAERARGVQERKI